MQFSQTLRGTSPVLLSTSRCYQTPLELSKALSDSARAFSGAPESTWSYGGAVRMLRDLTYRIVKFCSSWDLCADLQDTSRAAKTAAQLSGRLGAILSQQWFLHNYKAFRLLQSQDSLHCNIACIISVSVYIYIQSIWLQMVLEHNWRSTWTLPLRT